MVFSNEGVPSFGKTEETYLSHWAATNSPTETINLPKSLNAISKAGNSAVGQILEERVDYKKIRSFRSLIYYIFIIVVV